MVVLKKVLILRSAEKVLSLEAFVAGITNNIFTRVTIFENISLAGNDNVLRKSTILTETHSN